MKPNNWNKEKTFFLAGLAIVTIFLTVLFYSDDYEVNIVFDKKKLIEYYVRTLEPLFEKQTLNKKEIFEFASTGVIPYDNGKKQIVVRSTFPSSTFFKNKNLSHQSWLTSYDDFVSILNLSKKEQAQLDSILLSYRVPLETSILIGRDNSMAVSSDLNKLKTALEFDIKKFQLKIFAKRSPKMAEDLLAINNNKTLQSFRKKVLQNIGNKFLLFANDSVFTLESNLNFDSLWTVNEKEKKELIKNLSKNLTLNFQIDTLHKNPSSGKMSFKVGENSFTIFFNTDTTSTEGKLSKALNFDFKIEDDTSSVAFKIKADTTNGNFSLKMNVHSPDTNFTVGFNFNGKDFARIFAQDSLWGKPDSVLQDSIMRELDSAMKELEKEFGKGAKGSDSKALMEMIKNFQRHKLSREK